MQTVPAYTRSHASIRLAGISLHTFPAKGERACIHFMSLQHAWIVRPNFQADFVRVLYKLPEIDVARWSTNCYKEYWSTAGFHLKIHA